MFKPNAGLIQYSDSTKFDIQHSLRIRENNYLSFTPASNEAVLTKCVFSAWIKKTKFTETANTYTFPIIFAGTAGIGTDYTMIALADGGTSSNCVRVFHDGNIRYKTDSMQRDPTSHFHLFVVIDTTLPDTQRAKIWINGIPQTTTMLNSGVSGNIRLNEAKIHYIGRISTTTTYYNEFYISEAHLICGTSTPVVTDFGRFIGNTWVPKRYNGPHGKNGCYLDFSNNSSVTALGYDAAGLTNLYTYSQTFNNAAWLTQIAPQDVMATTEGVITDPVGTLTAFKLTAGSGGYTVLYRTVTSTANTRHTASFYLKAGTGSTANLTLGDPSLYNAISTQINLTTGAITAASNTGNARDGYAKSVDAGNGWWRVIVSGIVDTTSTDIRTDLWVPLSSDIYAWGAQLQVGDVKEYVPTVATARTAPNHWTPNGMTNSLTTGVDYDWMVDTPTNNFATLNPIRPGASSFITLGSLKVDTGVSGTPNVVATLPLLSGSWYWEVVFTYSGGTATYMPGIENPDNSSQGYLYYSLDGNKYVNGSPSGYSVAYTTNDVIGIHYNPSANTLQFFVNGSAKPVITGVPAGYCPSIGDGSSTWSTTAYVNFGQAPLSSGATYYPSAGGYFKYAPPAGARALCTRNL